MPGSRLNRTIGRMVTIGALLALLFSSQLHIRTPDRIGLTWLAGVGLMVVWLNRKSLEDDQSS